jgi:hypothetical protein
MADSMENTEIKITQFSFLVHCPWFLQETVTFSQQFIPISLFPISSFPNLPYSHFALFPICLIPILPYSLFALFPFHLSHLKDEFGKGELGKGKMGIRQIGKR